jgi:ketosteroid isomerase-like protein
VEDVIYDFLDRNTVLQTAICSFEAVKKTNPDEKPWIIAYTLVWRRETDGWKLVHMHNSWE